VIESWLTFTCKSLFILASRKFLEFYILYLLSRCHTLCIFLRSSSIHVKKRLIKKNSQDKISDNARKIQILFIGLMIISHKKYESKKLLIGNNNEIILFQLSWLFLSFTISWLFYLISNSFPRTRILQFETKPITTLPMNSFWHSHDPFLETAATWYGFLVTGRYISINSTGRRLLMVLQ